MMTIILNYLTPGLNGADGLMRQHFRSAAAVKEEILLDILSQRPRGHKPITSCRITYIRHTSRPMDWDNAAASFKYIGDALVKAKIITDDAPKVVKEFIPKQEICKAADHRTEIIIEQF